MAAAASGTPIGTWILAAVAVTSATIAAFQSRLSRLLVRPKLGLEVNPEPPDFHHTLVSHPSVQGAPADAYYFNLRVLNTGNSRAEQVEVFVADVLMQEVDGSFRRLTSFLPKNLLWSWTEKPFLDALSPGMYAFCTLGHIFDPARRRQFPGEDPEHNDRSPSRPRNARSSAAKCRQNSLATRQRRSPGSPAPTTAPRTAPSSAATRRQNSLATRQQRPPGSPPPATPTRSRSASSSCFPASGP